MDKFTLRLTLAAAFTVASALAGGGYWVGGVARDVAANTQQIQEMRREWFESRREMAALREEIARLNGLLARRVDREK